jgi:chromate transporter
MADRDAVPVTLTHAELFAGFFQAGIIGFGGVLPFARRIIVEQRRWMTQAEFNDLFSLCQFMPGANIVNFAFAFGARHQGVSGAAACVTGLLAAPIVIVLLLGVGYARFGGMTVVQHGLAGLAAAAGGLVVATAAKIAWPILRGVVPVGITVLAFGLVIVMHLSLPLTMLAVLPISVGLAWWA